MTQPARIPLAEPHLAGNEARYIRECVDSGYVSSVGPFVLRFEQEFAEVVGIRHAVACSSGTAALHVALQLAGARPDTLVAVSTLTFIASANAVSYTGADLWLVDSEPDTWNMNTQMLHDEVIRNARLGRRIPAVIEVVHLLGHPADVEPLLDLRDRFGIRVVEDAAEALGASWCAGRLAGQQVGTAGDIGCFSFNGNKIITSGGGGMIVTVDQQLATRAKHLTTQARLPGGDYWHDDVGYNYRMTNVAAAIGAAQLEQLPDKIRAKKRIASSYNQRFEALAIQHSPSAEWARPSYWMYSILTDESAVPPDVLVRQLKRRNIEARRLWPPLHLQKPYSTAARLGGSVAEKLYQRAVSLPSSANLKDDEQDRVLDAIVDLLRSGRRFQ